MDALLNTDEGKKELMALKSGEDSNQEVGGQVESYAGCTANVVLLHENHLYIANAGDSRSILSHGGQAVELSFDHKPDLEVEKERIKNAGGFIADGRINGNLNLSRAIGDMEYKKNSSLKLNEQLIISEPDIKEYTLTGEDEFVLMGCDGIYEIKTNQEIVDFIRDKLQKKERLESVLTSLLDWILAPDTGSGYGCDNMTTVLFTFKDFSETKKN